MLTKRATASIGELSIMDATSVQRSEIGSLSARSLSSRPHVWLCFHDIKSPSGRKAQQHQTASSILQWTREKCSPRLRRIFLRTKQSFTTSSISVALAASISSFLLIGMHEVNRRSTSCKLHFAEGPSQSIAISPQALRGSHIKCTILSFLKAPALSIPSSPSDPSKSNDRPILYPTSFQHQVTSTSIGPKSACLFRFRLNPPDLQVAITQCRHHRPCRRLIALPRCK